MIYVALTALAVTGVTAVTFARVVRSLIRQHGRREDLLINQICNLAGNPWQPPPSKDESVVEPFVSDDFVFSPEHEPEY